MKRRYIKDLPEEAREDILRRFPDTSCQELADKYGFSTTCICNFAFKHGVRKSEEYLKRRLAKHIREMVEAHTPESYKKIARAVEKLRADDRRRVLFGLPQKTNLNISIRNRSKSHYKTRMRRYGYIFLDGDEHKGRMYYTDKTDRRPKAEANAATHFLKILPLP